MKLMLLYVPFASGLAILVALLVIRLKRIRSNFPLVAWITAGVVVAQLSTGLFFVVLPPRNEFVMGIVLISMAITDIIAAILVYNRIQPTGQFAGEHPTEKIGKIIKDYNDELNLTTTIIERERIKNEIDKPNEDLNIEG
jgi:hypothetical protein